MDCKIVLQHDSEPVQLAAEELKHFLSLLAADARIPAVELTLAVDETLSGENDRYHITADFISGYGKILGSNPRSVLFGAYRLLNELGFRWLRPGQEGEFIPEKADFEKKIDLTAAASYHFRGQCIEGALSEENVMAVLEWMTRLGFNTFFIQFRNANTFFERWYHHYNNPGVEAEHFDPQRAENITRRIRNEVRRRGMDLQMVGHGWTCEPLGIPGREWFPYKGEISPEISKFFAEVNGKRELWGGIALNTNLCYSTPEVRELITDAVVQWSKENPDVNIIHFWLADECNNQCECPGCRTKRPADWYIDLLNMADTKLTAAGSEIKLVFLIYVDLLWPPEKSTLHNPDRFIMMFAPITRSYTVPFEAGEGIFTGALPPYDRNKLTLPSDPAINLAFLREWQKRCPVKQHFDFDYHLMWDVYKDPGAVESARILHQDCCNLDKLGLDGLVSCQSLRAFFPNGLSMTVMGRTLWDKTLAFPDIMQDHFKTAYGENWQAAADYFRAVTKIFPAPLLRNEGSNEEKAEALRHFSEFENAVEAVSPALNEGLKAPMLCRRRSWEYLTIHIEINRRLRTLLEAAWGGMGDTMTAAENLFDCLREYEPEVQSVLDVYEYIFVIADKILFLPPPEGRDNWS